MKTLQECKDEIARKHGDYEWRSKIYENGERMMEILWEEVVNLYASQFKSQEEGDKWVSVKERLPERVPGAAYSQVQCIVNKEYHWNRGDKSGVYHQIQILTFNHEHECWDGEDGDDYDCDINQVTHWKPLPSIPI